MHCLGVPAIGQTFSRTASVTARAAALRPPRFHGFGDGTNFIECKPRAFEKSVRRAADVLNFVGEIHGGHFARAFARGFWIFADAADDNGAEIEFRGILACFVRAFFHQLVANTEQILAW